MARRLPPLSIKYHSHIKRNQVEKAVMPYQFSSLKSVAGTGFELGTSGL